MAFHIADLSLTPCKNMCDTLDNTCYTHRDFYNKRVWMDNFMNLWGDRRLLLQGIDYAPHTSNRRIQNILEFSLNSGLIQLTEADVAAMETVPREIWGNPHDSLTDVFIVLCGTGKVFPHWNKKILRHIVRNVYSESIQLGNLWNRAETTFGKLLASPLTNPASVFRMMGSRFQNEIDFNIILKTDDVKIVNRFRYEMFVSKVLAIPQMRPHLLLSNEILSSYFVRPGRKNYMTPSVIGSIVKSLREKEMTFHKERMLSYKEGIAMAVCNPKNVERWLTLGGWPMLNMMWGDDDADSCDIAK
jgi:hypothetical protein